MSSVATEHMPSKSEPPSNYIRTADALTQKMDEWRALGYHVLAPSVMTTSFGQGYGVNASLVLLSGEVDEKGRGLDVYFDRSTMDVGARGLGKIALSKIAAATGVSWLPAPHSGRRDPLTIQHLWIYQVSGVYLAYDGSAQAIHGEKEIDYRDGSAQIGGWTPEAWRARSRDVKDINGWSEQRVLKARMNGAERAETGAMERAIRMGFGIKHIYSVAELSKPFVALRVCPVIDTSNPVERDLLSRQKMTGVAALYAGRSADVISFPSREPLPIGAGSTPAAAASTVAEPPVAPAPAPAAPPQPPSTPPAAPAPAGAPGPGNFVRDVRREPKAYGPNHAKAGQSFLKYHVVDGHGAEHVTLKAALAAKAEAAMRSKEPVRLVSAPNSFREQELSAIEPFAPVAAPSAAGLKL